MNIMKVPNVHRNICTNRGEGGYSPKPLISANSGLGVNIDREKLLFMYFEMDLDV